MYEKYPFWITAVSNLLTLTVYFLGAAIMHRLGVSALILYLLYTAFLEFRLVSGRCVHCHYFGKRCFTGRGKLSRLFFKKGDPQKFTGLKITWKSMIPDMLVSLVPVLAGIVLLFRPFDWTLPAAIVLLLLLTTAGNGFVRGNLACKFCKQRELGCPAEKLFNKERPGEQRQP